MHGWAAVIAIVCIGCLYRYSAPVYLSELYERSGVEYRILSSAVQRTGTKFGERAHVVAGPATWNQLLSTIRNSSSVDSFKTALKTFLFVADTKLLFYHFCTVNYTLLNLA